MIFLIIALAGVVFFAYVLFTNQARLKNLFIPDQSPDYPKHISILFFLIIIAYNLFIYGTSPQHFPFLGFALFNLFFLLGLMIIFPKEKRSPFTYSLFLTSLVASSLPILRANGFVQSINLLLTNTANLLLVVILIYEHLHWKLLWLLKNLIRLPFKYLGHVIQLVTKPRSSDTQPSHLSIMSILKTTILSLLVFVIFGSLLSAADPIFKQLMENIVEQAFGRIAWSIVIVISTAIILSLRLKTHPKNRFRLTFFSLQDLVIPTIIAVALFTTFLIIQARYLFASQESFITLGLTYSQYVRKGFTELLITTFLGGLMAYIIVLKYRLRKKSAFSLKLINVILTSELFLMLLSALKRNLMYIDIYGLTRVRIIGIFFLFWIAIFLLTLLLLTLSKRFNEKRLFATMWFASLAVFVGINGINIDRKIATTSPAHHQYIDHFYIQHLSSDAFPQQQSLLPQLESEVMELTAKDELTDIEKSQLAGLKLALHTLKEHRLKLYQKYADVDWQFENYTDLYQNDIRLDQNAFSQSHDEEEEKYRQEQIKRNHADWRQYNLPELNAFHSLKSEDPEYLSSLDHLLNSIITFQEINQVDLYEQEHRLLYDFEYPFISIHLNYYPQNLTTYHHTFKQHRTDNLPATLQSLLSQNQPGIVDIRNVTPNPDRTVYTLYAILTKHISSANPDNPYAAFTIWDLSDDRRELSVHGLKSDARNEELITLSTNQLVPVKLEIQAFSDTYLDSTFNSQVGISGYLINSWQEIKLFPIEPTSDYIPPTPSY